MKGEKSLDDLLAEVRGMNLRFRRLGEGYVREHVASATTLELWEIMETLIEHVKDLESRMGEADHRKLGG